MRSPRTRRPSQGFTLLELLVTLAVIGVLGLIGYPALMNMLHRAKHESNAREFANIMRTARLDAIKFSRNVYVMVDFANDDRAPLLFIAGSEDHIMPPSVNRSNAKHYAKSKARTDFYEFPGRDHFTCGEPGWEEVADYALAWAMEHARGARVPAGGAV